MASIFGTKSQIAHGEIIGEIAQLIFRTKNEDFLCPLSVPLNPELSLEFRLEQKAS